MRIEHDPASDTAYIYVADSISDGEAVTQVSVTPPHGQADVTLDFDTDGHLLGIEIIGAAKTLCPSLLRPQ